MDPLTVEMVIALGAALLFMRGVAALRGRDQASDPDERARQGTLVDRAGHETLDAWRAALRLCRVERIEDVSTHGRLGLAGRVEGMRVEVGQVADNDDTRIEVTTARRHGLIARVEGLAARFEALSVGEREIETGDAEFDAAFHVLAAPAAAHALLDADTRRGLLALLDLGRVNLLPDRLSLSVGLGRAALQAELQRVMRALLDVARMLGEGGTANLARRLADNVRADPLSEVRRRCLETLLREFPEDESTRAALVHACADADAELRLDAACAREEAGHDTLRALAGDGSVDDVIAARAIEGLGATFSAESARELLASSAAAGRVKVARACLVALVARPDAATLPALIALLRESSSPSLVAAVADALGALAVPAAEPELVEALRHEDEGVTAAAARALGALGSIGAVPALRELEGSAQRRDTRRAARQAVAAIQSRASGATPGQLSLTASETGQLALADDDERGRVSLADDQQGR